MGKLFDQIAAPAARVNHEMHGETIRFRTLHATGGHPSDWTDVHNVIVEDAADIPSPRGGGDIIVGSFGGAGAHIKQAWILKGGPVTEIAEDRFQLEIGGKTYTVQAVMFEDSVRWGVYAVIGS